jgi:small subunit ribosomal protein S16
MPVRIRLRRVGRKKQPSYRIVVAEAQSPRGGTYLDNVGFYNPRRDPIELRVDLTKVDAWVEKGAELTPTVASLVRRVRRGEVAAPMAAAAEQAPAAKAPKAEKVAAEAAPAEAPAAEAEATEPAETPAAE